MTEAFDAVVTGGSGFLWRACLGPALIAAGHRLLFLGRTDPRLPGASFRRWSPNDVNSDVSNDVVDDVTAPVFVHFASPIGAQVTDDNIQALAVAAAAQAQACGARHVVHASSGAVYGSGWSGSKGEDDDPSPTTPYGRGKLAAERALDAVVGAERTTHLRLFFPTPSIAAARQAAAEGRAQLMLPRVLRDLAAGVDVVLHEERFLFNPCPGDVLVRVVDRCLRGAPLGVLNVAGALALSFEEFVLAAGAAAGLPVRFDRSKTGPARSMLAATSRLATLVPGENDVRAFLAAGAAL